MTQTVEDLIALAKTVTMTPAEQEAQRRSFAYGNVAIENPNVTRELVDTIADLIPVDYTPDG